MNLKSFSEALKGKQHKLDADKDGKIEAEDLAKLRGEDEGSSVDRVARSDYKLSPSGRKTHKQITFREDQEVSEEKMTDAEMKKREDYVKGMKKNLSSFKDKYGSRAKEVMYATATKMAMKEELEESVFDDKEQAKSVASKLKTKHEDGNYSVVADKGKHRVVHAYYSDSRVKKEIAKLNENLDEAMSPQKQMDFDRMMKGAMSRAAYNAKWKKPLKSDEKVIYGKNVKEETETEEKHEMAQTQLHFIKYAAEEILEYIDMGGEIEEWYQNKLSKAQSDLESLHSYIEGEKRRTGMVDEEVEQIDEASNRKLMIGSKVTHPDHGKGKVRNIVKDVVIVRYDKKVNGTTVSGYHTKKDIKKMVVDEQTKPAGSNAPKMVRDRKTGEMYDPEKKFKELMNKPETKATMNRLSKEEVESIQERNKQNAMMRKSMDASRGARFKNAPGTTAPDPEPQHKTAQAHNKAIGRAIRKMSNEEVGIEEQAPVAPTLDRKYIKGTPENKAHKATKKPINGNPTNIKEQFNQEGTDMAEKITFGDFIAKMNEQLLEYESDDSGVYRHTKKATYGTSYQGDDDEDEKKPKQPAEKRGRGRPAGAKSGARKITGTSKLYK